MGIRTYGLSGSGMDIDQMVKDAMKAQQARYDKVQQQKTQTEWKKTDYNTIYTMVNDFRNNVLADFRMQSTLSPKQVTSSNDAVVTATANGAAANIDHSLVVKQLATSVKLTSSSSITTGSSKFFLKEQFGISSDKLEFKINGEKISIDVTDTTTINNVVSKINSAGAGVQATYDAELDRFFLYTKDTGAAAKIDFSGTDIDSDGWKFLRDSLKLVSDADLTTPPAGQDAVFTLDGVDLTKPTNGFTISGVTYALKTVSAKSIVDGDEVWQASTVAVKPDNDKTIATVKSFIEDYNALVDVINKEINEERYRDFTPLSDAQKADMKESEITAWEAKAKSGTLRRDSILTSMLTNMRLNFVNMVEGVTGKYNSASSLELNTGSYVDEDGNMTNAVRNGGKISWTIDTELELKKALEEDPDAVYNIFGSAGDTTETRGVANRLYDQLNEVMGQLKTEAGTATGTDTTSNLAKRLTDYDERLTALNRQLQMIQTRYYKQFDAMELAISRLSQQSSWLTQQLGGGNS